MKPEPTQTPLDVDAGCLVLLGRGAGKTHADEIKSLGLKVGDIIRGKEEFGDWWHEVRLTVVWVGEKKVVYRKQWRSSYFPGGWCSDGETANFTLSSRDYFLEPNKELRNGNAVSSNES